MLGRLNIFEGAKTRIVAAVGGPARLQIILVLAAILGLDMADNGTISAISSQLESAFGIDNTGFGLLLAVTSFATALSTLPLGVLADRMPRRTILMVAVLLWAVVMAVSGTATSYLYLLGCRVALGLVEAAAWPCIASLTGDFFPAQERAGIYGLILAGELIGLGIGFFVSGEVASFGPWRWSFYAMALLTLPLVWIVWRFLPEPARGGQSWLEQGETDPEAASRPDEAAQAHGGQSKGELSTVQKEIRQSDVRPRKELVLHEDPTNGSWWWAIRYFLKLPTYDLLIAMSALAYYFFIGFSTFVMVYFTQHYSISHSTVSSLVFVVGIGAIIGVVAGGRVSEWLLKRGKFTARIIVPGVTLALSVPFFAYSIWTTRLWIGVPVLAIAAGLLAAANPSLDAARLDIIHPRMWGRAEGGRMALRSTFEGCAPLLFGAVSVWLGGGGQSESGLMWTFLIMLIAMLLAGALAVPARRTYPRDVATAAASVRATSKAAK